jgi:HEPN domain-containing protein
MNSSQEIKQLANLRLAEARILLEAGKYDGAFYLAGYSVELIDLLHLYKTIS